MLDAGVRLAFGTDCPVEPPDPLRSIHAAVTRQLPSDDPPGGWYPEQRLTVAEAIHAYTVVVRRPQSEQRVGTLAAGCLADVVVLSNDHILLIRRPRRSHRRADGLRRPGRTSGLRSSRCRPARPRATLPSQPSPGRSTPSPPTPARATSATLPSHPGAPQHPIHNASGYFMPSLDALDAVFAGEQAGFFYSRDGNRPSARSKRPSLHSKVRRWSGRSAPAWRRSTRRCWRPGSGPATRSWLPRTATA